MYNSEVSKDGEGKRKSKKIQNCTLNSTKSILKINASQQLKSGFSGRNIITLHYIMLQSKKEKVSTQR